ncbi:hypothetical protein Taro_045133 [Colocasia esculenta]|uniref:Uncharacterized protein n=1 Tax=Colocasia esculenta TaxID=4460 RepID=A0A843WZL8_COLES|nr:hypothetical protein [Colocasia esculenta]
MAALAVADEDELEEVGFDAVEEHCLEPPGQLIADRSCGLDVHTASSSQTVASKYDIYSQVLGEDKPGRVRGLGTGPTPATLWGRTTDILKDENKMLGDRVKDLEERIAKLERTDSKFQVQLDLKSQVGDHD